MQHFWGGYSVRLTSYVKSFWGSACGGVRRKFCDKNATLNGRIEVCCKHACALITVITVFVALNKNAFLPPTSEAPHRRRGVTTVGTCVVMQTIQAFFSVYSRKGRLWWQNEKMPCGLLHLRPSYWIPPENKWLMWWAVQSIRWHPFLSVGIFLENNLISTMRYKLECDFFLATSWQFHGNKLTVSARYKIGRNSQEKWRLI